MRVIVPHNRDEKKSSRSLAGDSAGSPRKRKYPPKRGPVISRQKCDTFYFSAGGPSKADLRPLSSTPDFERLTNSLEATRERNVFCDTVPFFSEEGRDELGVGRCGGNRFLICALFEMP